MRIFWKLFVPFSLMLGGVWIALQMYIGSTAAANKVASRLQAALGVPVTVGGLEVGGIASAASNIAIFEADAPTGSAPFVTIGRATTDVGIADFISGSTDPQMVAISDVHLTLRYDHSGSLLTRLPAALAPSKTMPEFRLEAGTITITKDGEPDCSFRGIDAVLIEKYGQITLTGKINDPHWGGVWTTMGSFPRQPGTGWLELKNAGLHVTQEKLHRVPFVSEKVWKHVTLEGDTPVELRLTMPQPPAQVRYRITMSPKNTSVFVPSIDLTATDLHGSVVVEDDLVVLRKVRGKVAGGDLHVTAADLDYRNPITMMKFALDGRKLNIRQLPANWNLPPTLGGKLSGMANLVVRVVDGVAIPTGTGDGQVDNAMLGPLPIPNYGLHIKADRDGFSFQPRIGK